jgi:hypothetical protein
MPVPWKSPNAVPLIYELGPGMRPLTASRYLA